MLDHRHDVPVMYHVLKQALRLCSTISLEAICFQYQEKVIYVNGYA